MNIVIFVLLDSVSICAYGRPSIDMGINSMAIAFIKKFDDRTPVEHYWKSRKLLSLLYILHVIQISYISFIAAWYFVVVVLWFFCPLAISARGNCHSHFRSSGQITTQFIFRSIWNKNFPLRRALKRPTKWLLSVVMDYCNIQLYMQLLEIPKMMVTIIQETSDRGNPLFVLASKGLAKSESVSTIILGERRRYTPCERNGKWTKYSNVNRNEH